MVVATAVANGVIADTVDLEQSIENSTFTVGWLLDSLRSNDERYKKLHGNRGVKEVTSYDVSGGKGFISVVCRCIIKFVDSVDDSDIYTTVMKIPGFESLEIAQEKSNSEKWFDEEGKKEVTKIHDLECSFYTTIAPILDVPVPKVYKIVDWIYGEKQGCIHMEDLTKRGKTIGYFDNINLTQVKCFIRHLAHWHKNILSVDPAIWKEKYEFMNKEAFKNAIYAFDKMATDFVEKSPMKDKFDPHLQRYRCLTTNIDYMEYITREAMDELGVKKVIVHGDMHSGNLMFAIDENGDVQNEIAAFVDWQIMHEGSPMEDLAKFLTLCADGVVRRQAEQFAIPYYYECLVKEFGDEKLVPYTIEQLQKCYNLIFTVNAFFGLGLVPFFLGSVEDREPSRAIKDAYRDFGTLKALHMWEDFDRIMREDLPHIYERFGKNGSV